VRESGVCMNWRIVVAIVVAFVVGAGAGGLAEHERVNSSNKSSATKHPTTTVRKSTPTTRKPAKKVPPVWFTDTKAACPALLRLSLTTSAQYSTLATTPAWASAQVALLADLKATGDAYRALVPVATAPGKVALKFLLADQLEEGAAVRNATSWPTYLRGRKTPNAALRAKEATAVVAYAKRCPAS
jgi:hypothetical protein